MPPAWTAPSDASGADRPSDRIRDVVVFEVEEQGCAASGHPPNAFGAVGGEKLLAQLDAADMPSKTGSELGRLASVGGVDGDEYALTRIHG